MLFVNWSAVCRSFRSEDVYATSYLLYVYQEERISVKQCIRFEIFEFVYGGTGMNFYGAWIW